MLELRRLEREKEIPPRGGSWWSGWRRGEPRASAQLSPEMKPGETSSGSLAWVNWPYFTVGLVTRGHTDQEIQKIIGGNFLNLLDKVMG